MVEPGQPSPRSQRRRRAGAIAMYNDVFLRLLLAALITFVVIFGLAFVYVMPKGAVTPRAALPALDGFLRRASEGDALGARALLSEDLLRSERIFAIDALLNDPAPLAGYRGLTLQRFTPVRSGGATSPDMAAVTARVELEEPLAGRVDAMLVLENEVWRINDVSYVPALPVP